MDRETMAKCFNEWWRRYENDPEAYEQELKTIQRIHAGDDVGMQNALYMEKLAEELK